MTTRRWSDPDLRAHLREAAASFNVAELEVTCGQLVEDAHERDEPVDTDLAKDVLEVLKDQRLISLVQDVAETLLANGVDNARLRHRYALALLDHGRTAAAESLLTTVADPGSERTEIAGAIGRVHKQRYLTTGRAAGEQRDRDLKLAIETYAATYDEANRNTFYHGINAAALMVLAAREGVALPGRPDPLGDAKRIAEYLRTKIDALKKPEGWDLATAAEACLVLGNHNEAFGWMDRYVRSQPTAFQCGSTLRQLEDVWALDVHHEPGLRLIPLLRNRLLRADGGVLSVDPTEYTPESLKRFDTVAEAQAQTQAQEQAEGEVRFQAVHGDDLWQSVRWLRDALDTCRSVARIENYNETGHGTGFVIAGNEVNPSWPARVLLTNYHVIPLVLRPERAYISFRGVSGTGSRAQQRWQAKSVLDYSPSDEYDVCVLELPEDLPDEVIALRIRKDFPDVDAKPTPRAYVIGHPQGSDGLQVSLHDTRMLGAPPPERFAYYRSPTKEGSSGSPVFDDEWQVIALHHASVATYPGSEEPANRGIRFDKLRAFLRERAATGEG